jgi:hypothetical protein
VDLGDDHEITYYNLYVPGAPPLAAEYHTCGPCAALLRSTAQDNGQRLESRNGYGSDSRAPARDPWVAFH